MAQSGQPKTVRTTKENIREDGDRRERDRKGNFNLEHGSHPLEANKSYYPAGPSVWLSRAPHTHTPALFLPPIRWQPLNTPSESFFSSILSLFPFLLSTLPGPDSRSIFSWLRVVQLHNQKPNARYMWSRITTSWSISSFASGLLSAVFFSTCFVTSQSGYQLLESQPFLHDECSLTSFWNVL